MILDGDKLALYVEKDGSMFRICGSSSCSLSVSREIKKATKAPGSKWAANYAGELSYTLSASGLCVLNTTKANHRDLLDKIIEGSPFVWVMRSSENAQEFYAGTALIDKWGMDANYGDAQRFTMSAIGDGELNPINPYEIKMLQTRVVNGQTRVLGLVTDNQYKIIAEYITGGLPPITD